MPPKKRPRVAKKLNLRSAAFTYDPQYSYHTNKKALIGKMVVVCEFCNAKKFQGETPGICCSSGKVKLAPLQDPPGPLSTYMTGDTRESDAFLKDIRKYNSCFQMTSFGATATVSDTFKVQGQVYHRVEPSEFLQTKYFMGDEELQVDCGTVSEIRSELERLFHSRNGLFKWFKTASEMMPMVEYKVVMRADERPAGEHERRFNAPTINEVAIVIVGQDCDSRDIVAVKKAGECPQIRITETDLSYDALQYPLIFWEGEDGYHPGVMQVDPGTGDPTNRKVSPMAFYAHRIMIRDNSSNHIFKCRDLFHQFIVDMYVKVERARLLSRYKLELRVDKFIHLRDDISKRAAADIGSLWIPEANFMGSPKQRRKHQRDAVSFIRTYGYPHLFIAFKCNPAWEDINENLYPGQNATDRPDIIARVFKRKLAKLMDLISKKQCHIFGDPQCWVYSVKWKRRELPHAHILLWLKEKILLTDIDKVISAELPDPEEDPLLFNIVSQTMVHGPCGKHSPCMKNGACTEGYPRPFEDETKTTSEGYLLYRRRTTADGGFTTTVGVEVDNSWVVPYCPTLSKMFQAHINVEFCELAKSTEYINKYLDKDSDMTVFGLEGQHSGDEVTQYQVGRYMNSYEAIWRLLGFPIQGCDPTVQYLDVHLENEQKVYFTPDTALKLAKEPKNTTLTAFFDLCKQDSFARGLFYADLPKYYAWNKSQGKFLRRKSVKQVPELEDKVIGCVYTVLADNAECYFLRKLLNVVKGPKSFADLKTVDGEIAETYREACQMRGLLEEDLEWDAALADAITSADEITPAEASTYLPKQLRDLFAIMLTACAPSNPRSLWEKYKENLSEDILRDARRADQSINYSAEIYNQALILLEDKCMSIAEKTLVQLGLEAPNRNGQKVPDKNVSSEQFKEFVEENTPRLVPDQREAFDDIVSHIDKPDGGIFFLDAPGGTGKTFLLNLLLAEVRRRGDIAVAMASSGLAATLLVGGRTAHSTLHLPFDIEDKDPVCNIRTNSDEGQVLKKCKLIVWDECTMAHKRALEALDQTMRDIRKNDKPMGGATVVLAGDFRQILPVIHRTSINRIDPSAVSSRRSTPADELNACLKASSLWRFVKSKSLRTNMRAYLGDNTSAEVFAEQLLQLGDGKFPQDPSTGLTSFPPNFCNLLKSPRDINDLISCVFPNISENLKSHQWLCERAILAPRNDSVSEINNLILRQVPGDLRTYTSIDNVEDKQGKYSTECLNPLELPGMYPRHLHLKVGCPIILQENIDPPKLCNGTRLSVKRLLGHVIEATIITGSGIGQDVFIPRIPKTPSETDSPIPYRRLQFPCRPAFALTINKAQGQSLGAVGVNLKTPCFSHGQLYVACSTAGSPSRLWIYAPTGETRNVQHHQLL